MASDEDSSLAGLAQFLRAEHELLGAVFERSNVIDFEYVSHYAQPEEEVDAFVSGAALADLTGLTSTLISGEPAQALAEMACAGRKLAVGKAAYEGVLSGDGSLLGAPLLARTGNHEYLTLDATPRAETVSAWLGFLATVEQGGRTPFAGVETSDASAQLLPLLMAGPAAQSVLLDYLHGGTLPSAGEVAALLLDRIHCLIVALPVDTPAWLLLVPPQAARVLWRSFLSFPVVTPVGRRAVDLWLGRELSWYARVQGTDKLTLPTQELRDAGLIRTGSDFVGARRL